MKTDHVSLAKDFLRAYESKDLNKISNMFSESIVLRDWNSEVVGKQNGLDEFRKNFENAKTLAIEILEIYQADFGVAAQIEITVNGSEKLSVVDVITFNEEMQIASIVAYKGL